MDPNLFYAFGYGLLAGLLFSFYVWFRGFQERRRLKIELNRLRTHLDAHLELSYEGTAKRKGEIERLAHENENLRITVKSWQQKPDRRELRQLHVYDHAVRDLMQNAPGFAPHWERALQRAETLVGEEDRGVLAFARRLILPARKGGPPESE
jgi:hypothetical protein